MQADEIRVERARVPDGTAGETYLVVRIAVADAAVRAISGRDALPAHVTALGPFMPLVAMTSDDATAIGDVVEAAMPWTARFGELRAFEDGTLWLAPDDDRPFRSLTTELAARFPGYPPYGGIFTDVIPHLTLQERSPVTLGTARLRLNATLPVITRVDTLELWLVHGDGIEVVRRWPGGGAGSAFKAPRLRS